MESQKTSEELTLLNFWGSMFGARVRIANMNKGLSYEEKDEDLANMNKSKLLLELKSIHKKVPVLIHKGKLICESLIIVQYIDEVWNDKAPLLPSDPYQRAQARFWADFIDQKLYKSAGKIAWNKSEEEVEESKNEMIEIFKLLEGDLGDKPYFAGDVFGYLDIALIGFYMWFYTYEKYGDFIIEAECPKLIASAKRCLERESVAKSLGDPNKVYDVVVRLRKQFGIDQ